MSCAPLLQPRESCPCSGRLACRLACRRGVKRGRLWVTKVKGGCRWKQQRPAAAAELGSAPCKAPTVRVKGQGWGSAGCWWGAGWAGGQALTSSLCSQVLVQCWLMSRVAMAPLGNCMLTAAVSASCTWATSERQERHPLMAGAAGSKLCSSIELCPSAADASSTIPASRKQLPPQHSASCQAPPLLHLQCHQNQPCRNSPGAQLHLPGPWLSPKASTPPPRHFCLCSLLQPGPGTFQHGSKPSLGHLVCGIYCTS